MADWSSLFSNGLMSAAMNGGQNGLTGMTPDMQGGNPSGIFGSLSGGPMNISPPAQGAFNPTQVGQINGRAAVPDNSGYGDLTAYGLNMIPRQAPVQPMQAMQISRPVGMLRQAGMF